MLCSYCCLPFPAGVWGKKHSPSLLGDLPEKVKEHKGKQLSGCKRSAFLLHLEEKALEQRAWLGAGEVGSPTSPSMLHAGQSPFQAILLPACIRSLLCTASSEKGRQSKLCSKQPRGYRASAPSLAGLIQSLRSV